MTNFRSATGTDSLEGTDIELKSHEIAASEQIKVPIRVLNKSLADLLVLVLLRALSLPVSVVKVTS